MFEFFKKSAVRGFGVIKNNPQILYTIFLLIAIPFAFLISGQEFLNTARENQERIEQERIGLMYDVFVRYADEKIASSDMASVQDMIEYLAGENPSIEAFKVVSYANSAFMVIASLDRQEIGSIDKANAGRYQSAMLGSFFAFQEYISGERYWRVVKPITDRAGNITAVAFSDISMAHIDDRAAQNITHAYFVMAGIIFIIFLLLLRHARIIDYATLYRKLEEIDKMKDDFVSIAAHELRTPLTVIKGYLDLLSKDRMSDDDKTSMERINISVEQLNALVGDILDVARMQQGKMQFDMKRVDVAEIARGVAGSFAPISKAKHIVVNTDAPERAFVFVDEQRLKQIFVNLIGNAVKYTPDERRVDVSVRNENGNVSLRVSDTGIGISAEDQQHLFGKFFRVRTKETEDIRGTGLGLWITAQIVAEMGGRIAVESIKGKGTDFIVSFPSAEESKS